MPYEPVPASLILFDQDPLTKYLNALSADFQRDIAALRDEISSLRVTNHSLQGKVADLQNQGKTNEALLMQASVQNVTKVQFSQSVERTNARIQNLEAAFGMEPSDLVKLPGTAPPPPTTPAAKISFKASASGSSNVGPSSGSAPPPTPTTTAPPTGQASPQSSSTNSNIFAKVASVAASNVAQGGIVSKMGEICREELKLWFENSGVSAKLNKASVTAEKAMTYIDSVSATISNFGPMSTTVLKMEKAIEDRVTQTFFNASITHMLSDNSKSKDEIGALLRSVQQNSHEINELGSRMQDVIYRASEFTRQKVSKMYDTLCLKQDDDDDDDEEDSLPSASGRASVQTGKMQSGDCITPSMPGGAPTPQPAKPPAEPLTPLTKSAQRSESTPPPGAPTTTTAVTKATKKRKVQRHDPTLDEAAAEARGAALLLTPMFVTFRQAILSDISDRVSSSKTSTSNDFGSEVVALRADIRLRATASRVVELIKQHHDIETPAKVAELAFKLEKIERTLVTQGLFTEALRTKSDAKVLDQKVERSELQAMRQELELDVKQLREAVEAMNAERAELRIVAQELDNQVRRDAALKRLFPDGLQPHAKGPEEHFPGPARGPIQPFLPSIVKLGNFDENAIAKLLPSSMKHGPDSFNASAPVDPRSSSSRTPKPSRMGRNTASSASTGTAAVVAPPHVGHGNQTPISRTTAYSDVVQRTSAAAPATAAASNAASGSVRMTDNQEAYIRQIQQPVEGDTDTGGMLLVGMGDTSSAMMNSEAVMRHMAQALPPMPYEQKSPTPRSL